jgi:hypothetical protein
VNVVGQYADCFRFKWQPFLDRAIGVPKPLNVSNEEIAGPVGEDDREEQNSAFELGAAISGHDEYYRV